jgi:hypothetical protein
MGVIPAVIPATILLSVLLPQAPSAAAKAAPQGAGKPAAASSNATQAPANKLGVEFDPATGWPRTREFAPKPEGETAAPVRGMPTPPRTSSTGAEAMTPAPSGGRTGTTAPSYVPAPLAKSELAALGVVSLRWRASVFAPDGTVLGTRELEQLADLEAADRDRLDLPDGSVYGRFGGDVAAQRHGSPWPLLVPTATQDLQLYGLHARLPFAFADASAFQMLGTDTVARTGESLARVRYERRDAGKAQMGPPASPQPADQFALLLDKTTGQATELIYTLAGSSQERRVRLEDWRRLRADVAVQVPFRRVYLDAQSRPTVMLEIAQCEARPGVGKREFQLQ